MQGKIINGFELKKLLGCGGMAEVWYAENEIGKPAAVKILNESLSRNAQIVERFHNEALLMVKLDHPNIREVYGYGYIGERHCIIMEYLDGEDLDALLKNGRHFTDEELQRWWNQTVDALNYTHAMGIVHRDIKPSNLFLDKKGNIKLLDFGIAKVKEGMSMTRTGMTMGTLMYMSPEQVKDPKRVGVKSDVYSLAVTFVNLLTGKPIYDSDTSSEYDIQVSIVTQPVDLSPLPSSWRGFLKPFLEKDPDQRPALKPFEPVDDSTLNPEQTIENEMDTDISAAKTHEIKHQDLKEPETKNPKVPSPKNIPEGLSTSTNNSVVASQPKSKKGLWIGLGAAVLVLLAGLAIFFIVKNNAENLFVKGLEYYDTGNFTKAEEYLTKAANKDYEDACFLLAQMFLEPSYGLRDEPDVDGAIKLYRKLADKGNINAMLNLGFVYSDYCYSYDDSKAWYLKAIDRGDVSAQFFLGALEERVEYYDQALAWYKKAADNGYYGAAEAYKTLEEKLYGITVTVNGVSFLMKYVQGGTFQMGSSEYEAESNEKPVHEVTVSSYFIAETEVTQALWKAVMGMEPTVEGGWTYEFGRGDNYPAYRVSWNECQTFINKLNHLTEYNFRLPTEAEWEYAARGGKNSMGYKYAGSNEMDEVGWYWKNSGSIYLYDADRDWYWDAVESNNCMNHPVKMKKPNELGLYDMSGNVWELCQDFYGQYENNAEFDPQGPSSGYSHSLRGGSWMAPAVGCRVADRNNRSSESRYEYDGLRLAFTR